MTTTMPPDLPGSQRVVPVHPSDSQIKRLMDLLEQDRSWVLRPSWRRYLDEGQDDGVPISSLTRDQRIAALAWLRQQRHRLHAVLEGGTYAPDGWLERLPLYRALEADT